MSATLVYLGSQDRKFIKLPPLNLYNVVESDDKSLPKGTTVTLQTLKQRGYEVVAATANNNGQFTEITLYAN